MNQLKYNHSFVRRMLFLWVGENGENVKLFTTFPLTKLCSVAGSENFMPKWEAILMHYSWNAKYFWYLWKYFQYSLQQAAVSSRKQKQQECKIKSQVAGLHRINYTELICIQLEVERKSLIRVVYVAQSVLFCCNNYNFNHWQDIYDSDWIWNG